MAKPWAEVESSEQYRALGEPEQQAVRTQYFDAVVAPNVATQDLDTVREQFMREAGPSMGKSIGRAAKAAASGVANFIAPRVMDAVGDEVDGASIKTDADVPAPAAPASLMASAEGSRGNGMGREAVARVIDAPDPIRAPQLSADYGFREAAGELRQVRESRASAARIAARHGIGPVVDAPVRAARTWGESAADTGVQLAEGVNTIFGAVPNLVAPEGGAAEFFNDNAEFWRDKQSDALKTRIAGADKEISRAGEDGVIAQIAEASSQYFSDPALAARFVTTNLPSMIPGVAAAKVAQAAAVAKGATAVRAAQAATTAAGATNAVLNAGGARGEAFEDIKRTLIAEGMSPEMAERKALEDSRVVAAVGGIAGFVSGKTGLESSLFGQATKRSALKSGVAAATTEAAGEQLEEVAPKIVTNLQAGAYDNRSAMQDVGRTIVETGIGAGPGAVISGGVSAMRADGSAAHNAGGNPNGNTAGLATGSGGQSGPVGAGSAGDTAGDGIGAANPGQPGNGGVAGIDVAGSEPAVPVGTGGVTDAALTGDGSGLADDMTQEATPAAQPAPVMPAFAAGAQPTATAPLAQQPAAMNLPPELAARVAQIDTRTAEIVAEAPTRSGPVQASLAREAAKLERERAEIAAQAPIIEPEIIADNSPEPAVVKDSLTPQPDPSRARFDAHADDLRAMAQDAGWAEQGGKLIRNPDGSKSRTRWIPRAEWFMAGMEGDPSALAAAIEAQSRGERVPAKARRTIEGMMEWIEAQQTGAVLDEDASVFDLERASYNEASDGERVAFDMLDDVFALDATPNDADTAAGMRAMGFTDEEINGLANPQGTDGQGQGRIEQADARGTGERAADVRGSDEAPRQAQGESESRSRQQELEDFGLLRESRGRWQYKTTPDGAWKTASTKADAIAVAAEAAAAGRDRLKTSAQRAKEADAQEFAELDLHYRNHGIDELKSMLSEHANNPTRFAAPDKEFDGNGGRRTQAATQNEAARAAGEHAMRLRRYVAERERRESDLLTSYTPAELARREQAARDAQAREAAEQQVREQKAQADAERDNFALTGSDRGADVLASQGQGGLFDAPAAPAAKPAPATKRVKQSAGQRVGLKVGDTVTFSANIDYLTAGTPYVVEQDGKDSIYFRNPANGGGTSVRANMIEAWQQAGRLTMEVTPARGQSAPAKSADAGAQQGVQADKKADTPTTKPDAYGAKNKLVSNERAVELRARLKSKLNQLNSGIDPEMLAIGTELAAYHIEAGARRFVDFARAVAADLDTTIDRIRPYLRGWYNGARDMIEDAGMPIDGMDNPEQVREALATLTTDTAQEQGNVTDQRSGADLESDRGDAAKAPVDTAQTEAAAEAMGLKIVEHTTQKGKVLRGVVRTDLNKAQAQEIDPYTFKKDGGWFVREKHLAANEPGAVYTANEPTGNARGRDDYTQDLFGEPVPDEGRSRRNRVEQQTADDRDVLAAKSVPGAKFATITGPRVTDTLKSGFDVIDDAGKAAHVFAGLRRSPQERFAVLILDRNKRPISYVETGAGAVAQVSVYPEVVTKAIYDEPNAAYVWVAHNHPSGMSTPSEADRSITKTLSTAFGHGTGVEMLGHVVLARTDYSQMDGDGGGYYVSRSIPAAARTHEIQIKQRRIQKAGHLGGNISGPEDAMRAAQDISDGKTGVLFLSVQNYPVAFLPMSAARMQKLRDGESARELFGAVARSNAGRAILYFEPGVGWDDALAAAKNVNDAIGGPRDVNVLDAIYHTEAGHTASMAAQLGTMPGGNSSGAFFSRADRADTGRRIHREDLDAVAARYRAAYPRVPVQVHDTEASAPKALREDIRKHGAQGDVAGAWHEGTIHLFRSGIENIEHAEFTALHEGTHAGLTALFGPALDMHLMDMNRSNPSLRDAAAQIAKRYGLSQVRATEEALADMGGEAVRLNGWQKLVAFVRKRLRKLGFVREWSDNDIIGLVEAAREHNRKAVGTTVFGGARFSRGDEAQTEAGLSLRALRDAYATAEARMADILANDPPDVDTWSSASNAAFDTKAAFVAALSDSNDASFALSGKTSDGRVVTLNASAQQPGKWQLTRFDRAGAPWGDTQYPTKKGAITDFLSEVEPGSVSDFDRALSQSADARYSRQSSLNQQPTNNHLESARRKMSLAPKRSLGERIRAGFGAVVDALKTQRGEYADAMRQGMLDQFHGIKRAEQRTLGNLPAEQSAYVAARLATGSASVMRAVLLNGQPQWAANGQHLEKKAGTVGLLDVLQPVKNELDDWIMWMVGNRAGRLMGEGRENLFTPEEIAALKALANGREARFKKAADDFAAFKRSILDVAEKAGLLDKTTRPAWDHADWIPFYRQREESGDTLGPRGRRGMAGQSSGIRMLKGGESALNDPLENIIMNFQHLLDASLKNNAVRKAIAHAKDVTEPVGMDFAAQIVPASEIRRVMHEQGVPDAIIKTIPGAAFEGIRKMWSMQAPNDPDVIRVMVDGKARYFRVKDPLLLRAVTSFQPFDFPGLGAARFFRRLLTASVTATPEFMLRNFIRDTVSTAIISRDMVAAAGAFKGMVKAYRETGAAEQMMFAGASFQGGYIDGHDRERTARQLRRALRDKGLDAAGVDSHMASLIDGTASLWEHYKKIGESIENANREAVFEATSRAGKSATEAAYEAKDLMDFSLRGSWAGYQLMADVLPFFNARVQGMYRLARSNPKALAVRGALMLTVPSLLLALANVGDDRYEELPDWDKDTYWHFFIGGEHFRIPKPFEVGVFFATMPERMVAAIAGDDDGRKFLGRAWWNLHEQLNLVDWPQIAKPVIEAWANRNTFTGRDIESMGDERKLPSARYDERTSAFMRELVGRLGPLADATGLSPKKAEHILIGYTGTFGAWGLAAMDAAVREAAGDPARPRLRPDDLPILRVFYRGDDTMPARSTQHVQDVYDGAREYQKVLATAKSKFQEGRADEGRALLAEPNLKWQAPLSGAAEAISAMNKRADRIMLDRSLSPEQKRVQLDDLLGRRNELARQAVKKSREVRATID